MHYQFEKAFLIVGLIENDGKMMYSDPMPTIKESLIKIFDEIIKVSHQLIRPESTLRKTEKQFLPEMSFEDESYRLALTDVSPALNDILEPLNVLSSQFETDYTPYTTLDSGNFVKTNPTIKKIKENFAKIDELQESLNLLPFYSVARMIEIDFKSLKSSLV